MERTTKTNYEALEAWYLDRITAGEGEEIGSLDSYEDETGFMWFITKTGGNTYDLTTEANPIPFAEGSNMNIKMFLYWYANGDFPYKKGANI